MASDSEHPLQSRIDEWDRIGETTSVGFGAAYEDGFTDGKEAARAQVVAHQHFTAAWAEGLAAVLLSCECGRQITARHPAQPADAMFQHRVEEILLGGAPVISWVKGASGVS